MSWIWTRRRRGVCRCHSKHVQFTSTRSILALWKCALSSISSTAANAWHLMWKWWIVEEILEITWKYLKNTWHLMACLVVEILEKTWKILEKYLKNTRHLIVWLLVEENACLASQRPVLPALTVCLNWSHVDLLPISCSHNWSPDVEHWRESQGAPFELWKGPLITILASLF